MKNYVELKNKYMDKIKIDGTYNENGDMMEFDDGYQVSFESPYLKLSNKDYNEMVERLVSKYKEVYVGVWHAQVELSFHVMGLTDALYLGRLFDQVAIWDWKNGKEIFLKGN